MPSFYSISGTKSLKDLLPIKTQRSNEIGISEHINLSDGKLKKEFIDHIISNGKAKKQYNLNNTPITLLENTLFSNEIDFLDELKSITSKYLNEKNLKTVFLKRIKSPKRRPL